MFGIIDKLRCTWGIMGASWRVLKKDRELLLFPLLSGICCLLVLASFAIPLFSTGYWEPPAQDASTSRQVAYYAILFLFYFANYFVIVFFNSAIVACAVIRLQGGDPTVSDGLHASVSRLPQIFGWALVSATVSLILRIIEDRSSRAAQIIAGILGMAWSMVTFLVVPVMVVEKAGPVEGVKRSTSLLRQTWGEQLMGNFSFGLIFALLGIPGVAIVVLGIASGSALVTGICVTLGVLYLIALSLVSSALDAIFRAAVYLYAHEGEVAPQFGEGLMQSVLQPRS